MGNKRIFKRDGTISTGTISALRGSTTSPLTSNRRTKFRPRWSQKQKPFATTQNSTFKGVNKNLEGKVFTIGPDQASRNDDTLKSLLGYISKKYDHRVTSCIQYKDKSVGGQGLSKTQCTGQT